MTTDKTSGAFGAPRRGIYNDVDMRAFADSSTKKELLSFVEAMGNSCAFHTPGGRDSSLDPSIPLEGLSPSMACLHGALRQMITWIDDFPPTNPESARFGNPAFRQWHARLKERSNPILTAILNVRDEPGVTNEEASQRGWDAAMGSTEAEGDSSIEQVSCYLHDSFGHATRLDYGTGHESSFLVFLLVLSKVKCLGPTVPPPISTLRATTLSIFDQYLKVTRRLQTDYRLEPAGSHGVWGLDDYHCLPFYFGACQLQALAKLSISEGATSTDALNHPKVVNEEDMLKDYGDYYMYLGCIRYIRQLKQGVPFFESSPMLYDISQTMPAWDKVARGMLRLYQGEVLDKRQVVQHFLFSKFFPMTWEPSHDAEPQAPTETFRPALAVGGPMQITRAPWASTTNSSEGHPLAPTRAPWADAGGDPMAPTKAPWAK